MPKHICQAIRLVSPSKKSQGSSRTLLVVCSDPVDPRTAPYCITCGRSGLRQGLLLKHVLRDDWMARQKDAQAEAEAILYERRCAQGARARAAAKAKRELGLTSGKSRTLLHISPAALGLCGIEEIEGVARQRLPLLGQGFMPEGCLPQSWRSELHRPAKPKAKKSPMYGGRSLYDTVVGPKAPGYTPKGGGFQAPDYIAPEDPGARIERRVRLRREGKDIK